MGYAEIREDNSCLLFALLQRDESLSDCSAWHTLRISYVNFLISYCDQKSNKHESHSCKFSNRASRLSVDIPTYGSKFPVLWTCVAVFEVKKAWTKKLATYAIIILSIRENVQVLGHRQLQKITNSRRQQQDRKVICVKFSQLGNFGDFLHTFRWQNQNVRKQVIDYFQTYTYLVSKSWNWANLIFDKFDNIVCESWCIRVMTYSIFWILFSFHLSLSWGETTKYKSALKTTLCSSTTGWCLINKHKYNTVQYNTWKTP